MFKMTKKPDNCDMCKVGEMLEIEFQGPLYFEKGVPEYISGIKCFECNHCKATLTTPEQLKNNQEQILKTRGKFK
mgnify:CR=1 FL=1